MLRIDDIPQQVADDIHAFGVIGMRTRFTYDMNLFLAVLRLSLFLAPSFILLLPIMLFIGEIVS